MYERNTFFNLMKRLGIFELDVSHEPIVPNGEES
jgi:hypothetical protein